MFLAHLFLILEFFDKAALTQDEKAPQHLIIAMSSDRGLCGAIHGNVFRAIRGAVPNKPPGTSTKFICVGDKQKTMLQRSVHLFTFYVVL